MQCPCGYEAKSFIDLQNHQRDELQELKHHITVCDDFGRENSCVEASKRLIKKLEQVVEN